jgi:serine phosphatase RsbU (regulator of sigma subunit)
MKTTGRFLIVSGILIFLVFLYKELTEDSGYYYVLLPALSLVFLGSSFLLFPLPLIRRKKIVRFIFLMNLLVLGVYYFLKTQHYPGAAFLILLFFNLLVFLVLPLHTRNRIEKWKQYTSRSWQAYWLSIADLLALGAIFSGLLFRVFQWPVANALLVTGLVFFAGTLISWNNVFSRQIVLRKEAEEKLRQAFLALNAQKSVIEEKNAEVLASITYARRLQTAILPSVKNWQNILPRSFILYKPKDIVAGDFYWAEKLDGKILFAVADCTGHGVPGAMVSVVCSNALNRSVKEFGLTDPGKILDKVRELVIETFENSESEVKDGMDICLCVLDQAGLELKWAGANNPLWHLSSPGGAEQMVLNEIRADKQPVGKHALEHPFTTRTIHLKPGDQLYLFTDGYADQFGGPDGKKFKYKPLKELLVKIAPLKSEERKAILEKTLNGWMRQSEQVDDVCIVGVDIAG